VSRPSGEHSKLGGVSAPQAPYFLSTNLTKSTNGSTRPDAFRKGPRLVWFVLFVDKYRGFAAGRRRRKPALPETLRTFEAACMRRGAL
jgi:hypothetical protein